MVLFLGIDGGGTGCRAAVADASGRVLGHGQSGPANITSDLQGARANILDATAQALSAAVGAASVAAELPHLTAGLGLAGANAAGASGQLQLALPFARMRIETDAVAAVKGALGAANGIVAALGTGSVFAVQQAGVIRQFGGWGLVLGDEGSGAWLGRAALSRALRAVDGFVAMTPFLSDLLAGVGGPAGAVTFAATARPTDFARLAPQILESADAGARVVVMQACADVGAVIDQLRAQQALPVTFIGGLGWFYAAHLAQVPQHPAIGTALDGALMLAREAA